MEIVPVFQGQKTLQGGDIRGQDYNSQNIQADIMGYQRKGGV